MSLLPKLLIVDDEEDIGNFVRDVAEELGYEAYSTTDPEKLKSLYDQDIHVIVLDLMMPGVDGVELLRFLSEAECRSSIILMSGFDQGVLHAAEELAIAQGLTVVGSLTKPIRFEDMQGMLDAVAAPSADGKIPTGPADSAVPSAAEMQSAIKHGELIAHFQPQIDLRTRQLVGAEALVRWQHPQRGTLQPALFIGLAEQFNLIDDLTNIVLDKALKQGKIWLDQGLAMQISVNMSAQTLNRLDIPEEFSSLVQGYGLMPSQICIEVTESAVMHELVKSLEILTRLRIKGFSLSIDDFGTGYSSMQQLQRVPFTELKVDQAFVTDADTSPESRAIVESTINLGHKLGMKIVAEGIENEDVMKILIELGCDVAQGYYIAKPMPGEEMLEWHRNWS